MPFREGAVLDFAALQTRLGRVGPDPAVLEKVPVVLVAFDLLHLDGVDLLEHPLRDRRSALEALGLPERPMRGSSMARLDAPSAEEVDARFDAARAATTRG